MATQQLRRGTPTSVPPLNAYIRAWIQTRNGNPPLRLEQTADQILARIGKLPRPN
ncbi:hypothetical protein MALGJ_07560 [Mycolicibacter algericus]|uniref:Uncharacterized protein n=1 Tax=Mycolicibacter algericus TaxID=1288388 RepID=A0A7I9Y5W7_MYCAL|nr:hypothetical protein MALGJ_07560 [Mycolicibacter algericus]